MDEAELVEGRTYFAVQFLDPEMHLPIMEPVVFLGRSASVPGQSDDLLFQSADTSSPDDDGIVYAQESGQCQHIFEFERALEMLMRCSIRRSSHASTS